MKNAENQYLNRNFFKFIFKSHTFCFFMTWNGNYLLDYIFKKCIKFRSILKFFFSDKVQLKLLFHNSLLWHCFTIVGKINEPTKCIIAQYFEKLILFVSTPFLITFPTFYVEKYIYNTNVYNTNNIYIYIIKTYI